MDDSERRAAFRSAIVAFIDARREAKLKDKDGDSGNARKFAPDAWLADAARRVAQIQAVTHVAKATHPDARSSSLHVPPTALPPRNEIGTHTVGADFDVDVVGNAAALDVFKFLKTEVEGRRLLDWMQAGDLDLQRALHRDADTAQAWMAAFSGLVRRDTTSRAHGLAKQVYWLVGDEPADDSGYHLLQPVFSSTLAHAVHGRIQEARFGDAAKAAREARWKKLPHDHGVAEYTGLAARKLGGSKPQNVSQLNSERGGVNYLLASLPPRWRDQAGFDMLGRSSAIDCLGWLAEVRALRAQLIDLLRPNPEPNLQTRTEREAIERALGDQLGVFAANVAARHAPGWTRSESCALPLCEQLWLDPERADLPLRDGAEVEDQAFKDALAGGAWADQVAERYGNWINAALRQAGVTAVGDDELRHWARQAVLDVVWPTPIQRRAVGGLA